MNKGPNPDSKKSAMPCGCDEWAEWVCERHQQEFAQFEEDHLGVQRDDDPKLEHK